MQINSVYLSIQQVEWKAERSHKNPFCGNATSGNVFIENGSKFAKGGKYLGKGVAGVGFGIGMYDDLANDDKTFGEALSHNGMTLAAGSVAAFGVAALVSNPVGWAVVGILNSRHYLDLLFLIIFIKIIILA